VKRMVLLMAAALFLTGAAMAQESGMKIGVFDSSIVFDRSQHGQDLKADVERLRDLRLKEMGDKQQELETLRQEMRTKDLTFNEDTRDGMLQRINQLQIDLQRMNDDATREVQAEFNQAQKKLQLELLSVVDAVGRDGSFSLILEKGLTLYAAPDHDITGLVLDKFDEMFPVGGTAPAEAAEPSGP